MAQAGTANFIAVMAHRSYRNYTLGRIALISAMWMERIGYGWLAWELTRSEIWLGTLAASEMLVILMVTPVAGALADRVDPIRLMMRCHQLSMLWSVVLLVSIASGQINIYLLILLVMLKAASSGVSQPVGLSMVNNLIGRDRELLGTAIAINATAFHLSRIIGPALGGLIIASQGVAAVFAIGFLGFLAFVLTLHWGVTLAYAPSSTRKSAILADVGAGLRYASTHSGLIPVLLLGAAGAFLLRPYIDLLPSVSDVLFNSGANGLAILAAASGIGGLIGSIHIMLRQTRRNLLKSTANIAFVTALLLLLFSQLNLLWLGVIVIAAMALTDVTMGVGLQILMQTRVDEEYRGRCISLLSVMVRTGPPTSAFIVGLLTSLLPLSTSFAVMAVIGLAAIGTIRAGVVRKAL